MTEPKHANPLVQAFLDRRRVSLAELDTILAPEASHQHSPFLLADMERMVEALHEAKEAGRQVLILPDYDADGVLSGTVASVALYLFGFKPAHVYHPRVRDGYGMTPHSVDRALLECPTADVILTTDNGSNAHAGVEHAKAIGLTVLVTDHHLAMADPVADVVVNPNRRHIDQPYPYKSISGTAVIYKVFEAYNARHGNLSPDDAAAFRSLLLLVGMSTITDVMPMRNENRYFVEEAVRLLTRFAGTHTPQRVGMYDDTPLGQYYRGLDLLVYSLNQRGKLDYGVDASTFGFMIGPMLNSPRRMSGSSSESFALFETMRSILLGPVPALPSENLFAVNESRKAYVGELTASLHAAMREAEDIYEMTVFTAQMKTGVAGLLAGEFSKATDLPVIAFGVFDTDDTAVINPRSKTDETLTGSGRAPGWFDLHATLTHLHATYPGLLVSFGGHQGAAGVKVKASKLELLRGLFAHEVRVAQAEALKHLQSTKRLPIAVPGEFLIVTPFAREKLAGYDGEVHFTPIETTFDEGTVAHEALAFFGQAAPFGEGFTAPTFTLVARKKDLGEPFFMGAEKNHVKCKYAGVDIIRWKGSEWFASLADDVVLSLTGEMQFNEFRGRKTPQLIVQRVVETVEQLA